MPTDTRTHFTIGRSKQPIVDRVLAEGIKPRKRHLDMILQNERVNPSCCLKLLALLRSDLFSRRAFYPMPVTPESKQLSENVLFLQQLLQEYIADCRLRT
jgi:hypothetical protein